MKIEAVVNGNSAGCVRRLQAGGEFQWERTTGTTLYKTAAQLFVFLLPGKR